MVHLIVGLTAVMGCFLPAIAVWSLWGRDYAFICFGLQMFAMWLKVYSPRTN